MDPRAKEPYEPIQRHLLGASEELLGLHRVGVLSYEQYAAVANLLVDAGQNLNMFTEGTAGTRASGQTIPLPFWLFAEKGLSPLAKWTYGCLLKLRREFCQPGRNALVINLKLVSSDVFSPYAWTEKHLLSALEELSRARIISTRKMDYPQDTPEQWEIDFLREDRL